MDLKKAFDTVNHQNLCLKLEHSGIRGPALNWMKDYLTDRKKFVQLGNTKSDYANVTCGIPQGSILGPLLFSIYVNDMQQALTHGTARLFADDTNITYCGKNLNGLKIKAEIDMTSLIDWFKVNKLVSNVKKSNFLIIRSHYKRYLTILL